MKTYRATLHILIEADTEAEASDALSHSLGSLTISREIADWGYVLENELEEVDPELNVSIANLLQVHVWDVARRFSHELRREFGAKTLRSEYPFPQGASQILTEALTAITGTDTPNRRLGYLAQKYAKEQGFFL